MQNMNKILQEEVGTERSLLVEHRSGDIAGVHLIVGYGLHHSVAVALAEEGIHGEGVTAVVAQYPVLAMAGTFEHRFE